MGWDGTSVVVAERGGVAPKVMVVDDDKTMLRFVSQYLQNEGYEVVTASRGPEALRVFFEARPDLVFLDVMMPGMDGWEVCARMRELSETPIVMLTAKTGENDKLRGFRLGIDDYVTKPFSLAELGARARAILVRTAPIRQEDNRLHQLGDLEVDLRRREAYLGEALLKLTPTEFRLLAALAERAGEAVSQDDLIREVWGDNRETTGSALRRYIWFLRQKIEADPEQPSRLKTIRGYGYRLEA